VNAPNHPYSYASYAHQQEKAKASEPKKVESQSDSSEESDVPLGQISAAAKTFTSQRKKRRRAFASSGVSPALFFLVLQNSDESSQTLTRR